VETRLEDGTWVFFVTHVATGFHGAIKVADYDWMFDVGRLMIGVLQESLPM